MTEAELMWTYPELRFVHVNQHRLAPDELARQVNIQFHGGDGIRTAADIKRINGGKNIFNRDKQE
jgi:hypothetical protein